MWGVLAFLFEACRKGSCCCWWGSPRKCERKEIPTTLLWVKCIIYHFIVMVTPFWTGKGVFLIVSYHYPSLVRSVECGVEGEANRRNLPCSESQHGKAIMSSSSKAGRREKLGGRERGKEGGRGKRYENMTCLRIGSAKTIHSSGFPQLPCSLLHLVRLDLAVSSDHIKGSLSLPPLARCLILREQFTSRAKRQWPACLHPGPFLFSTLCDMGMPLNHAKSALKCYWMLWKPPICL